MGKSIAYVVGAVCLAVVVFIIGMVVSSLKRLNSDEVAIKYNNFQKKLYNDPSYSGLHTGPPGYYFIKFPSVFRTLDFAGQKCLNKDGVETTLAISFQYRVRPSALKEIILQFRDHDGYKSILTYIGESAIHDSCSQFNTSQFQAERGIFQEDLRQRLVAKYDTISTDVTDMQVNNIVRPSQYENAIRQKERAREDIVVARNERPQALTEAETKMREATTQADIILNKARSDAKIMTVQADLQAQGILNQYKEEAATYKRLVSSDGLGFNQEGLLAYVGIRAIEKIPITVGMKAPAQASYAP